MRRRVVKKLRQVEIKQAVKKAASKPAKTGLHKSDPNYYSKIGQISAKKRKLPKSFFSAMASKSHEARTEYKGGRKKKNLQSEIDESLQ